ncbi:hypothetical protein AGLY_003446 [Aphis glycines]|uniref:CCHC-type domain-containing protein n=1 Tax=Aphis glycines TaxID=307491 RepID=A0A6G0U120_APHGL|nr:hypothetical protein AGLY_003446 [Aphis glycines]
MEKSRSPALKEAIEDLLAVVNGLKDSREPVILAVNAVLTNTLGLQTNGKGLSNASIQGPSVSCQTDRVTTPAACTDLGGRKATDVVQQKQSNGPPARSLKDDEGKQSLGLPTDGKPKSTGESSSWAEVTKKKKKKKMAMTPAPLGATGATTAAASTVGPTPGMAAPIKTGQRIRSRPAAILIDVKSEDFPALAKKIRSGVDHNAIGDRVVGMRQAKAGGLLIEVRGDVSQVEAIRSEIARSAGEEVTVKTLRQNSLLEIRDLDQWSTAEEIALAVASSVGVGRDALKVLGIRKSFGGSQKAVVLAPSASVRGLLASGRIKVGMVSCRVRLSDQKSRCFRCLAFGHMARDCSGPDRTLCCRRCGEAGHKAASCCATPVAAQEFAKLVGAAASNSSSRSSSPRLALRVIQVNLNHCWVAQQLLSQTMVERDARVALICDYARRVSDTERWVSSSDGKCAILVSGDLAIGDHGAGVGFVWAIVRGTLFYSCYYTPNCSLQEFDAFLSGLEASVRLHPGDRADLVVAGDFNAHSAEWGSATDDARGSLLSDFASALGLLFCNIGSRPTYSRLNAESVIDVTMVRTLPGHHPLVVDWSVLEDTYSASDHHYITFAIAATGRCQPSSDTGGTSSLLGWSLKKLCPEALSAY